MSRIAALYVANEGVLLQPARRQTRGIEKRDARRYAGPYPVVAHPPCARWGRYWGGAPTTWPRLKLGDDNGCFAAALDSVRRWGGVLEHPEGSHAWRHFELNIPPRSGGWVTGRLGWRMDVLRRTGPLRSPRKESDVVIYAWHDAAVVEMGKSKEQDQT